MNSSWLTSLKSFVNSWSGQRAPSLNKKKKTECFAKFIRRIRRSLKNFTSSSVVCVSYESDLQLK